jgi:hypothetical protein
VSQLSEEPALTDITYKIVEHAGGWAYKLGDVFSETFASREDAVEAARRVAAEQEIPGEDGAIEWEDEKGRWHEEQSPGDDRPHTRVED